MWYTKKINYFNFSKLFRSLGYKLLLNKVLYIFRKFYLKISKLSVITFKKYFIIFTESSVILKKVSQYEQKTAQ